jgi:hypothetical protein
MTVFQNEKKFARHFAESPAPFPLEYHILSK